MPIVQRGREDEERKKKIKRKGKYITNSKELHEVYELLLDLRTTIP